MDAETHAARRLSFGAAADNYDRIRPSYPIESVRWLLGEQSMRVADLGAGTGIFTRVLEAAGHEVIAVEPDDGMRDKLLANTPHILALVGSAESIPLPDASVDAVVAAQAYHWFDTERAHPEIARVLKVGSVFGLVWNVRDESVDWVRRMSEIVGMEDGRDSRSSIFDEPIEGFGPLFDPPDFNEFRHVVTHDAESMLSLVRSRSYWLTAAPEIRVQMETEMRRITADLGPTFDLPYFTCVFRTHRL